MKHEVIETPYTENVLKMFLSVEHSTSIVRKRILGTLRL